MALERHQSLSHRLLPAAAAKLFLVSGLICLNCRSSFRRLRRREEEENLASSWLDVIPFISAPFPASITASALFQLA
jgi:hypothetical protein